MIPVMIRSAKAADIPQIMHLERQCPSAAHWTEQQYKYLFQDPDRLLLVSESQNADSGISGFLIAHQVAPEWELENVVISPTSRRKGLGTRLLQALFTSAREAKSKAIFLEVRESNAPARLLYENAGFQQASRRKAYYFNPEEDAIVYRKILR